MEVEKYTLHTVSYDQFNRPLPPTLTVQAAEKYGTRVDIHLSDNQIVSIYAEPDCEDDPKVFVALGEGVEEGKLITVEFDKSGDVWVNRELYIKPSPKHYRK